MRSRTWLGLAMVLGCGHASGDAGAPRGGDEVSPAAGVPYDELDEEVAGLFRLIDALRAQRSTASGDKLIETNLELADVHLRFEALAWERAYEPDAPPDSREAMRRGAMEEAGLNRRFAIDYLEEAIDCPGFDAHPRAPDALVTYSGLLVTANRRDDAREVQQRIIAQWPEEPPAAWALVSLGDLAFEDIDLAQARQHYEAAQQRAPNEDLALYAIYKLGWIDLNEGDGVGALERFTEVVKRAARDPKHAAIGTEASKDLVRAYAQVGLPEHARGFFGRLVPQHVDARLAQLAAAYRDAGKLVEAQQVYRDLLSRDDGSLEACGWQVALVEIAIEVADGSAAGELQKLAVVVDRVRVTVAGDPLAQQCANRLRRLEAEVGGAP